MPQSKLSTAAAKRESTIADAVNHALYAMRLVNGMVIESAGGRGSLSFEHEIAKLEKAQKLLSVNLDCLTPIAVCKRSDPRARRR